MPVVQAIQVPGSGTAARDGGWAKVASPTVDVPFMDQNHRSNASEGSTPPIHSTFEGDPDLQDLVVQFVDELDRRVDGIRQAFVEHDMVALRRIAHQLKGAAGGYGFDPIGEAASRLEYDLLGDEAAISSLSERVEDLIANCRAAVRPQNPPQG